MSEAAAAVRWLLQQDEPEARRVAVQQIAKVHGPEAAELLVSALRDEDWRVRKEAAAITPALDSREDVVAALVSVLEDRVNIGLRNAAVEALVAIGPDALSATVAAFARIDADARKLAVEVLGGVADPRCTVALAGALDDQDTNVRVAAAEALGRAGLAGEESRELAIRSLVLALSTGGPFLTLAALESLARLEARLPWRTFEPYVEDPLLRRYAVAAACGSREPDAVSALALATGDASPTIAREAVVALGELVAAGPQEGPLLEVARLSLQKTRGSRENARRAALQTEDSALRRGALALLGLTRDPDDVALLVNSLGEDVAERADLALRLFGPDAIGPMLAAVRQAGPSVRAAALELAASFEGERGPAVHEALRRAIDDPSPEVVASAVESLGPIGDVADLMRIASIAGHPDERIASAATNALWSLAARHVETAGDLARDAGFGRAPLALACILLGAIASTRGLHDDEVRVLERALAHDRPQVRRAAIDALAQAGGEAASVAVAFALADEDNDVQLAAVRALGRLRCAEPLFNLAANTTNAVLTAAALRALGNAEPARAVEAAGPLVKHADVAIACAAVEAIGHLAMSRVSTSVAAACDDALFSALDHDDADVVKQALSIVGARSGPRALARLGLYLDHGSPEVRRIAAELLGQDWGPSAQALLRARYERERDPAVRNAIATAASFRPVERGEVPVSPPAPPLPKERA